MYFIKNRNALVVASHFLVSSSANIKQPMKLTKQTFVTAFALFSLFFGAGNLIFPAFLGYNSGDGYVWVALGFVLSAVVIPIMAVVAHARLQGTMLDFATKVSPAFALIYCIIVYAISISFPSPRTASVTYEMSIQPYLSIPSWGLSLMYFSLVLFLVWNRSKILDLIGKYLTPGIISLLAAIIGIGLFGEYAPMTPAATDAMISTGILEGYQTFDAIGGVVVGAVVVISLRLKGFSPSISKRLITRAGLIAGIGFVLIYFGLIALGALVSGSYTIANRVELLNALSEASLGAVGQAGLSVLVALACFTTAVGIVAGTADFIKGLFDQSETAYKVTAIIGCVLGVVMGQLDVHSIIVVAFPALMLIYPVTIVLIALNVLPQKWATPLVFRWVIVATLIFSLPDFLSKLGMGDQMSDIQNSIPLGAANLGWLIPSVVVFLISNLYLRFGRSV